MKRNIIKRDRGFTLIELMITIAILAIIAAIAIPSYDRYKRKGYRMEAISFLSNVAAYQENWFAENGAYTANPSKLSKTGITTLDHYSLSVNVGDGSTFLVTATAKLTQTSDKDCYKYTIDNLGRKKAEKDDASDNSRICWGS